MKTLLHPSDAIAVVAPSHPFDPARLQTGMALAQASGWNVEALPELLAPHLHLAGSDDHRATQLIRALTDPGYQAVWMARGGSGLTRILDRLPYADMPARPVIGFSDVTALLVALHAHRGGPLIHGPVLHSLHEVTDTARRHLALLLKGQQTEPLRGHALCGGQASGPLVGGNLTVLAALCGTPWQLDAHGSILFLEDVGEPAYRIDRSIQQLKSAGVLDGVKGIALGSFADCNSPASASWTLTDVLLEALEPCGVPLVSELPFGHIANNHALPYGVTANLEDGTLVWNPRTEEAP
jgi:muramoyltetrapeptide carboxypeptidase